MRWLIIKNALITMTIGFVIVWLSSRGEYLATASVYPTDFVFLWLGVVLAGFASIYTINDIQRGSLHKSAVIYAFYYYGAFGLFADGHVAGWAHSTGYIEKLFMSGFIIFVSLFSIVVPLIVFTISVIQAHLLSIAVENRQL
ncbi:hypothetical protein A9261_04625 [Vibrio tasmaniensis]|nr:hypothetical protein A9261_04625 [Vibrio tasmaniensis]